jgi:hypothetical protein
MCRSARSRGLGRHLPVQRSAVVIPLPGVQAALDGDLLALAEVHSPGTPAATEASRPRWVATGRPGTTRHRGGRRRPRL